MNAEKVEELMLEKIIQKRDDNQFMKHTLSWCDGSKTKIDYKQVNRSTLSNDVQYFPPQERVY